MLLFRLRTIWKTVNRKFYPTRLIAQTLPLWIPFVPVDAERPHWNTVHIRTGYQKLAWFIRGCQAGAVLLGWNPQIDRKMGKSHSFRWAIFWVILLYMFFLNKRSNFEKKPHELSYRSNISCSNSKWQYIFFRKISERYFIVKNNKNFIHLSTSFYFQSQNSVYTFPHISPPQSLCPWPTFCPSWEYYCAGFECRTSSFAKSTWFSIVLIYAQ